MKMYKIFSLVVLFILGLSISNCKVSSSAPKCDDGEQNGNETGIDCGGDCEPCDLCSNNILDPGEVQVDCGGTCPDIGCERIPDIAKELMITDLNIIDSEEARSGEFSFGHMMRNMAKSDSQEHVKEFVLKFFETWESSDEINGFDVAERSSISSQVIDPWIRIDHGGSLVSREDWEINLNNAPFRLMAITSRVDLHKLNDDDVTLDRSGEGRFTYCLVDPTNLDPKQFTIIFEFNLPGETVTDLVNWTKKWHHLGSFGEFNEEYTSVLKMTTNGFTLRGSMPNAPNGSAIAQVRTNENALSPVWELREFNVDASTGLLTQVTRKQTPDISYNSGQKNIQLAQFLNANADKLESESETLEIPNKLANGDDFMAGNVFTEGLSFEWKANGVDSDLVHKFSLETCNGCHGVSADTRPFNPTQSVIDGGLGFTTFTHIKPRFANERTVLSNFLAGSGSPDNDFENELDKRVKVMRKLMGEIDENSDSFDEIVAFIKSRGNRTH